MTWIATRTEQTVIIAAPPARVLAFLDDIEVCARLFPNLARVERQSETVYRWVMAERTHGPVKFTGDYVLAYATNGHDELTWRAVSGNVRSTGWWRVAAAPGGVTRATMHLENEADLPVPGLFKAVARPFAQREVEQLVRGYAENIRRAIEAAG
ncbi:MAG TPA: SRPBCC family protein [Polyangia bacterium]|jgi:carbon monoxide dehydrogenase subunit G